jgi:hypothetical protein
MSNSHDKEVTLANSHGLSHNQMNNQCKIAIDLDPAFYHWRGGWLNKVVLGKAMSNADVIQNDTSKTEIMQNEPRRSSALFEQHSQVKPFT